jgi:site-specific DNA-methyltransferase (adenine-specific)
VPDLQRILRDNRHWYVFASPRRIGECEKLLATLGSGPKHVIAWDKGDRGTVGDLTAGFGEAWEAIFYGMKGRRNLAGARPRTVFRFDWSATLDPVHPTVKPVPLLARLIEMSTAPGEAVIDPFAGSGTTALACIKTGRAFIGCEVEEHYAELSANRIDTELSKGRLFQPHELEPTRQLTLDAGGKE